MKRLLITALIALAAVACSKETQTATPATPKEKTYAMTATILSRDPTKNTVNLDNKEVPGEMGAMKMDYELRGAKAAQLPADGTPVVVTVHDVDGSYYITDVKPQK
ncbi:MAG TPA: copper-binding protein [Thermoanaerobaculia bacterium]|nr:copper-binding protein [Thermoanaerobaculia bacterium]